MKYYRIKRCSNAGTRSTLFTTLDEQEARSAYKFVLKSPQRAGSWYVLMYGAQQIEPGMTRTAKRRDEQIKRIQERPTRSRAPVEHSRFVLFDESGYQVGYGWLAMGRPWRFEPAQLKEQDARECLAGYSVRWVDGTSKQ